MKQNYEISISDPSIFTTSYRNLSESDGKFSEQKDKNKNDTPQFTDERADFETAITATGFGKFNLLLLTTAIPSCIATAIETTTMAYVLPIAQCDLDLSLEDKGILNAVTYLGMLPSAFVWGYLADTIGRKKPLIFAYLLNGLFVILCGLSRHYTMLLVAKFMTGLMINGSFATVVAYINELHAAKQRSFIPLIHGSINGASTIMLPLMGWLIFSDKNQISLFNDTFVLRSWNIFFLVCSLPSIIAGLTFLILPESPKYLMSMGKNEEAYKIFQKVYALNSGLPADTFPIKSLIDETQQDENNPKEKSHLTANRSTAQALKEGWHQIVPLFHKPYVSLAVLVFIIQFGIVSSLNTLRLWLPQIFTAVNDYQTFHSDDKDSNLCKMLAEMSHPNVSEANNATCFVNYDNDSVYINNVIISVAFMGACLLSVFLIRLLGKKILLVITQVISGICVLCLYFAVSEEIVVLLSALFIGITGIGAMMIVSIIVDIFPTTLRTMTISCAMLFARAGAMSGNLVFPLLLVSGCLPPFLTIALFCFGSALLSLVLPKTDDEALK